MKRRFFLPLMLSALMLSGCAARAEYAGADAEPPLATSAETELPDNSETPLSESASGEASGEPDATAGYIVVRGFEWGPGVSKVVIELDAPISAVSEEREIHIVTAGTERAVTAAYPSDEWGNRTSSVQSAARYAAFELDTSFDHHGSPFALDEETGRNEWVDSYIVEASFTAEANGGEYTVIFEGDCIENRLCPELDRFAVQDVFSGTYENPLTGKMDELSLRYAAYEPDTLQGWEQNPLIIWLHGQFEGGEDITKVILGQEVSALTEKPIQDHFVSGEQYGAYVLVVQTPTYWLDPGSGDYAQGDLPSRYTRILMETIWHYLQTNPDVDPDRIYIGGASNGGYMTLEMLISYPGFFAAGFPCCSAYAYYEYVKDDMANYTQYMGQYVRTDEVNITDGELALLAATPLWFIDALTDTLVPALEYSIPMYHALLRAGAENCWFSLYFEVDGVDSPATHYLGHWVWIYLFNDEVALVQDAEACRNSKEPYLRGLMPSEAGGFLYPEDENGVYYDFYDWLNAQSRA